ncbi:putative SET domain-containing protein [Aspergillus nomiae NRRL 13137]|uniref:Putative SET domain-containing protein n=1 Tax=Aspergillus nomiae NRRL (strain ATCC 15546 / NRRL 13137 / CBS 260.88 / M93) TaxID=1509407 RepID=A0A0L1J380_ASPN3|nr:putative SET domain-containing protein [Aspergillus nomiae NRRL 13137]KNG85878.1 putative SET domain-containing protein [Aspergillus nomiae NRRL 13137]
MKPDWWPGEEHEQFTEWAISQGIIANGVGPARFPGRGLGMIATRNIEEDEAIVIVPLKAMLTAERIPSSFTGKFPDGTPTHALYAAFLTNGDLEDLEEFKAWRKTWPSRQDFEDSMPMLWSECLRNCLPPSISSHWHSIQSRDKLQYETSHQNLLAQQEQRLRTAWDIVVSVFPDIDWEMFSYHWLIVNTRSFFYLMPGQEPPEDRNDAMALLPFADYFNHSDVACNVKFDGEKYVFRATKHYDEGEEIYMSYGPHPNDFLFAEYGFYLDENESETLYLDDIILKDLGPSLQEELEFQQYYGQLRRCLTYTRSNYQLTATGVCYRTEIAACINYMSLEDWRNYVLGYSTKGADEKKSEAIIQGWIRAYSNEADTVITTLEEKGSSQTDQKDQQRAKMLKKRWTQIRDLCAKASKAVSG